MRKTLGFVLGLACLVQSASGQNASSYFPTDVGNTWTWISLPTPPARDTTFHTASIGASFEVSGRNYFRFMIPFSTADTLRADSLGQIWEYTAGTEHLLFDFTLPAGSIYDPSPSFEAKKIIVTRDVPVDVPAGRFEGCMTFDVDRPINDGDLFYAFAPGVGLVLAIGSTGQSYQLASARLDSTVTTGVERLAHAPALSVSTYPNPFSGSTMIRIEQLEPGTAFLSVAVYDLLGRKIDTLFEGRTADRLLALSWNAAPWPRGVYFVRIQKGTHLATRAIMHR